jgi:TH1 protein
LRFWGSSAALQGQKLTPQQASEAETVLQTPVAAAGVVHSMEVQLSRADYWRELTHLDAGPTFLALLGMIIPRHPLLVPKVPAVNFLGLVPTFSNEIMLENNRMKNTITRLDGCSLRTQASK